jgi:hypothetical protein
MRSDYRDGLCFTCKKPGHQQRDCPERPKQHKKYAFIKPTSAQNEQFQAFLRSQQTSQPTTRKRAFEDPELSGSPAWKKSATLGWVPRGTKPTAMANVASDDPQDDELLGAAGLFEGEEDFDPNVYRPDGAYSD